MTSTPKRIDLLVLLAALLVALTGCEAVGDFCTTDDDCGRGLKCTARQGKQGICTYPQGVPDRGPDRATRDLADDALTEDLSADHGGLDQARTDGRPPDSASGDSGPGPG